MAKRARPPAPVSDAAARSGARPPRPDIVHTSVYLPEAVYEALRVAAFKERRKPEEMIAMTMSDVDRLQPLSACNDPINDNLSLAYGQSCVDKYGVVFAID